ncbi:hypothetical protein F4861DRAFT_164503 [Xylaria intraflava]|nr:hypothetical protein F4861DRAFT_164503 [Xylaria intraflava]
MSSSRGRRRLEADLEAANLLTIPNILQVVKSDVIQDGFVFTFTHPQLPSGQINVNVAPQDAAGYPGDNYFRFATSDECPDIVASIIEQSMMLTIGMFVREMLRDISRRLCAALDPVQMEGTGDTAMLCEDNSDVADPNASDDALDCPSETDAGFSSEPDHHTATMDDLAVPRRVFRDFHAVRNAGFRVGQLYWDRSASGHRVMSISIKVEKLELSKNTRDAWNLKSSDHIVLLMRYLGEKYLSFEEVITGPYLNRYLEFRVRKCNKYRPTSAEALLAFLPAENKTQRQCHAQFLQESTIVEDSPAIGGSLSTFGVGSSIERFLNQDFLSMMKLRTYESVSWEQANILNSQTKPLNQLDIDMAGNAANGPGMTEFEDDAIDADIPRILSGGDHLLSSGEISVPLVAMQFTLHYLVKCTKYCMICHERVKKVTDDVGTLKPYVCDKPLCLFHYMSLSFCPTLEQEIINQQHVVDLLISLCYASLQEFQNKPTLSEFPLGLGLEVPRVRSNSWAKVNVWDTRTDYGIFIDPIFVDVSWRSNIAILTNPAQHFRSDLGLGKWVVIYQEFVDTEHRTLKVFSHARIEALLGSSLLLKLISAHPVPPLTETFKQVESGKWTAATNEGLLVPYSQTLEEIESDQEKAFSMALLLASLPSVGEMREYLMEDRSRTLETWDEITPGALKLLRWIIASNRSHIVQLDNNLDEDEGSNPTGQVGVDRTHEKITGVDDWIQFKFAQGSPETEARFQDALKEVEDPQRTILAWHGSGLGNWFSIIHAGLNFDSTSNGRMYGDGVYFSRSFDYSMSYSTLTPEQEHVIWPRSDLNITRVISLNELVNQPKRFVHSSVCYVVDALHWIQCRYLLVRPKVSAERHIPAATRRQGKDVEEFVQESRLAVLGPQGQRVIIPRIDMEYDRDNDSLSESKQDGDLGSDTYAEDEENFDAFTFDSGLHRQQQADLVAQELKTDFRPGAVDRYPSVSMENPDHAMLPVRYLIAREFKALEKIQSSTPLHELGWYIDFKEVCNVFQFIVELHSFDQNLPLAQGLKKAGLTSILIEVRVLPEFPIIPPFVRVVEPRLQTSDGNHVTAGGALCLKLLTSTGWSPVYSLEDVIKEVRKALCDFDLQPLRLDEGRRESEDYVIGVALSSYIREANLRGWEVPVEFNRRIR